ncbi:hypothetical protein [Pedobacter heparinus]|uniref:Uncharacterized protein n=1 Tax=Pedobacter heparinus (strain ATCC 13125 / DSM 2366 / CIP 104194 / JCM 7457 / NBRC 12017 / NCIMB 9290 / NRRL B-14731 / HIM 762-3) TaxID=485917 RepID=C6Y3K7_PEDHD|nr:hypothetical protein [Pedobacter heparinus]ACU03286.1 hypothetical protein Phep_1067 [Pedobacter heparinus DSM 2366]
MKRTFTILTLFLLSSLNSEAQETLQTVTDRGNTTSNRISLNPVYQFGSRITAYGAGSGYFDIYNNSNSSISLALKRSDGASVFEVDGHSMSSHFGGNVGIGIADPTARLDISGGIAIQSSLTNISTRPPVSSSKISGEIRAYSLTHFMADDGFLRLSAGAGTTHSVQSYIDLTGYSTVPDMNMNIVLGAGGAERMRILGSGDVGIGTNDPKGYKLAVNGKIRAQEIKVENTNWPDYVFTKDYQLPTLQQTENHIKEKGHLPGIPSAAEVKANGIDLGEMNAKLLQKIEELTLHLIEQQKQIKDLNERVGDKATISKKDLVRK